MNEGGFVFVEGVKLAEPEYPKGVKLTEVEFAEGVKLAEPDLLIACVTAFDTPYKVFVYPATWNSLQAHYNGS